MLFVTMGSMYLPYLSSGFNVKNQKNYIPIWPDRKEKSLEKTMDQDAMDWNLNNFGRPQMSDVMGLILLLGCMVILMLNYGLVMLYLINSLKFNHNSRSNI